MTPNTKGNAMEMNDNEILFCWGECPSLEAAVTRLANDIRPSFLEMTKTEREAVARVAIRTDAGSIQGESHTFSWRHVEVTYGRRGDVIYTIV